jgi:hypothetical protein
MSFLLLAVPFGLQAQDKDADYAPLPAQWNIMSQHPGALEAAAKRDGHVSVPGPSGLPFGDSNYTILEMIRAADLIVVGTVSSNKSYLFDNGRLIESEYTISVSQTLKGEELDVVKVVSIGGKVIFSEGGWAQVRTATSKGIVPGAGFLLFLRQNMPGVRSYSPARPASVYNIVGRDEGVIQLDWANSKVISLSSLDDHTHSINTHLVGTSPSSLLQQILTDVAN